VIDRECSLKLISRKARIGFQGGKGSHGMSVKTWFFNIFGGRRGPKVDDIWALTEQFHVTLQAHITKVEETATEPPPKTLERIRRITAAENTRPTWQDAYDMEQQLVHLYDENTLNVELARRLLEADVSLHSNVSKWYRNYAQNVKDKNERRALLLRLINDLQWRYTRNEARRGYNKEITARTELIFMLSVVLFLWLVFELIAALAKSNGLDLNHWGLIPFVGSAGAFGASFSMMTSLKTRLADSSFDDLKLNRSYLMIFARVLVGIGAGFLLFFFVKSGLLAGEAFPDLGKASGANDLKSMSASGFAKLFIWSFIAGFSEKLVPNLLSTTEGQKSEQTPLPEIAKQPPPGGAAPEKPTTGAAAAGASPGTNGQQPSDSAAQDKPSPDSAAGDGSPGQEEDTDEAASEAAIEAPATDEVADKPDADVDDNAKPGKTH